VSEDVGNKMKESFNQTINTNNLDEAVTYSNAKVDELKNKILELP
jgi:hypothetical protein